MSGGSSAPANTTQTTTKEIPLWAQPSAMNLLQRGEALSNQPYQAYTGQRIADLTGQQTTGLNLVQNRALYGSPEEKAARQNFTDTLSGKYLGQGAAYNPYADMNNPYLKGMVNQSLNDVTGRVNSQFNGNNYGTTAHQETLTRNLGEAANNAYGQAFNLQAQLADANANRQQSAYSNERNNQLQMAGMLPQYGNIDYNNAQQLIGVGDIYRQEAQDRLNNQYADWAAIQNQPYRQLDVLGNSLGAAVNGQSNLSSTGYQSNPYTANKLASSIGGGLAGYGLGNAINSDYGGYVGGALGTAAGLLGG
jgi:hypothetical protein